jgi:hypothetical protein
MYSTAFFRRSDKSEAATESFFGREGIGSIIERESHADPLDAQPEGRADQKAGPVPQAGPHDQADWMSPLGHAPPYAAHDVTALIDALSQPSRVPRPPDSPDAERKRPADVPPRLDRYHLDYRPLRSYARSSRNVVDVDRARSSMSTRATRRLKAPPGGSSWSPPTTRNTLA